MLKATYAGNTASGGGYNTVTEVKAIDLSVDYCDPTADACGTLTVSWPTQSIGIGTVTDPDGNVIGITTGTNGVTSVVQPASTGDDTTITYDGTGKVATVTQGGALSNYTYVDSGGIRTTTVTGPGSTTETYATDIASTRLTSATDQTGKTTTYLYDSAGRKTRETLPEGNYTQWTYDTRGNVTEVRQVAKSGSGLADIVSTANFDITCANVKTCNQPHYTIDPGGNRTDYLYDSTHGGVTRVQLPASAVGQPRPQIDYTYTALYAQTKNSSGTLVSTGIAQYKLTQITTCATAATCSGTANETKITLAYNTATRILTSKTVAAGDNSVSATETYTYDRFYNVASVDGPLSGTDDTSYYFYNYRHKLTGVIGPDPDGAGALKRRAERRLYDAQGRLKKASIGTVTGTTLSDLTAMVVAQQSDVTYDTNGNAIQNVVSAGGTSYEVTQYSYDSSNRLECTALRMNPAVFGSLPSSACSLGTTGTAGPDRITKVSVDAAGRTLKVQTAYGTADQADESTATYSNNGRIATLTDAQTNRTTYEYDGFDRLSKTRYPVTTAGLDTSSTTDYEQLTYGAAGNITNRRLRDASSIAYGYDLLNRPIAKNLPGTELDVAYAYDLLGRPTSASTSAQTLSFTYDAFGRNLTQSGPLGTLTSQYNAAGQRIRLTWPDSFYVTYDYRVTGEMTAIRENGATSGVGVLATYAYDDLGRRTTVTRGNGTTTGYGFDSLSRLSSLTQDLASTANDLTLGFGYNSASQIASTTRSNDGYSWLGSVNLNRPYTVNGLNQATVVDGGSVGYDARGNLNSTGANSYTYSSENLLLTGPGATAAYDPLMRLYQTTGSVTELFAYDGLNRVGEYNSSGTLQRRYVYGPGADEPVLWYEGSGTSDRRWLQADERGSVIAVTNSTGGLIGSNAYDEYGVPGSGNLGKFQYTGQTWLPDFGLYYYKARIYSSKLGRFMQTDPIGYADGINWYSYVGGDPINLNDPSGQDSLCNDGYIIPSGQSGSCDDGHKGLKEIFAIGRITKVFNGGVRDGGSSGNMGNNNGSSSKRNITKIDPCTEALSRLGGIEVAFGEVNIMAAIGINGTMGTFRNLLNGDTGSFFSFGFSAGTLDISGSGKVGLYKSLGNFAGFADNYSATRSFRGFAEASTTSSFSLDGSYIGQSGGASYGLTIPKLPSFGGSTTETYLYDCKLGK